MTALLLLISAVVPSAKPDEVPLVGRPSDLPFSDASGWFEARTRAEPTTVEAETPFAFTLWVHALREVRRPPRRIDLHQLPAFEERFYIEDTEEEPRRPDARTWEFVYRLKPRRPEVRQVPGLPFIYFNPYLGSTSKGFQTIWTDPIPLHVLRHERVPVSLQAPEIAFVLVEGPALLEHRAPWTPPRLATILAILLAPPILCTVWYLSWRRFYPDAARQADQRRSRAARQALHHLHAARRLDGETCTHRTASLVIDYLRQRLDLAIAEPTPREAALWLAASGCSPALSEQAVRFFETCDQARFLPDAASEQEKLPESAEQFILAVEAELCTRERS